LPLGTPIFGIGESRHEERNTKSPVARKINCVVSHWPDSFVEESDLGCEREGVGGGDM
jgi:hypothetical protein